jgi:hypothetical protein
MTPSWLNIGFDDKDVEIKGKRKILKWTFGFLGILTEK